MKNIFKSFCKIKPTDHVAVKLTPLGMQTLEDHYQYHGSQYRFDVIGCNKVKMPLLKMAEIFGLLDDSCVEYFHLP